LSYSSSAGSCFLLSPWPCCSAPSLTERWPFCQRLSPVLPLPPSPPSCISFLDLTIKVQTCMFASGRGVKKGVENKEQVWRRVSLHLNACFFVLFWLTLSVWSLEFSFQFLWCGKYGALCGRKLYEIKGSVPSIYAFWTLISFHDRAHSLLSGLRVLRQGNIVNMVMNYRIVEVKLNCPTHS